MFNEMELLLKAINNTNNKTDTNCKIIRFLSTFLPIQRLQISLIRKNKNRSKI